MKIKYRIGLLLLSCFAFLLITGVGKVSAANSITSPDTVDSVGYYPSIALDSSGFPVVAYDDQTATQNLKILHCGNANCSSGNSITSPDAASSGPYPSIVLDSSGFPVVSYWDSTNSDLKILHCGNANCTSGNTITSPDTTGNVGGHSSLALDSSGFPVVAYRDITNQDLKILHCGNANCSSGNSITSPDTVGNVGDDYNYLALDSSGFPVVSYHDGTNDDLKVLHCGNVNCTSGNTITSPDAAGGSYPSLALDSSGFPVVSYWVSPNVLKIIHCGDANCSSGNIIASPAVNGNYLSLRLDSSGFPVVAYRDYIASYVKVLHCGNANCTSGNSITSPDTIGNGQYTFLVLDSSGFPVVAYEDGNSIDLKILHCVDANCTGTAAPTVITSAVTSVTNSTAVLNGTSSPNGTSATGWFRYSTTSPGICNDTFGTRTSSDVSLGSGSSPVAYSKSISGLTSGNTYYVCAISTNGGMSYGSVQSFTAAGGGACASVPTSGNYTLTNNTSSTTFDYTGSEQTWVVPSGVTSVTVDAAGGGGQGGQLKGGRVQTTLAVTPGETLRIYVGGQSPNSSTVGGFNGGGTGGAGLGAGSMGFGGSGASDIRQGGTALANRVIVAGGGGGQGFFAGGSGGGTTAEAGGSSGGAHAGASGGGTPTGGGAGGSPAGAATAGTAGSSGQGGNGGAGAGSVSYGGGGGGGGGYYGGGGGGGGTDSLHASSGGGGSSFAGAGTSNTTHTQSYKAFNGQVIISYTTGGSCIFPNSTFDGVDGGSGTNNTAVLALPAGYALTIGLNQTISYGSITKQGATIVKFSGGVLQKGPLWIPDTDGDGYPDAATTAGQQYSATQPTNYVRRYTATTLGADCNSGNANVLANQTVATDVDQDGYATSTAGTVCAGASTTVSGRTYYKNSSGSFGLIDSASMLGSSDCNDANASGYINKTCYADADQDGYTLSGSTITCGTTASCNGTTEKTSPSGSADCYDSNANAYPGQTAYFTTNRGDVSFDYNCDGFSTQQYTCVSTGTFACTTTAHTESDASWKNGWLNSPAACGSSATFLTCDSYTPSTTCDASTYHFNGNDLVRCIANDANNNCQTGYSSYQSHSFTATQPCR